MRVLHGTPRHPGVAIAVAVTVDVKSGLSGLPDRVLRQGLRAVKTGLAEADQPEVIVACDLLAVGSALRIPGVRTAAIAAERDDQPALDLQVPCVIGVADLLRSVGSEEIAIVDGDEGTVYLDADARTVVRYQSSLQPQSAERVFLESVHIPARTQDGRTMHVAAVVTSIADAETAISQGADSLVVPFPELVDREVASGRSSFGDPGVELFQMLLALATGKPLLVALAEPDQRLADLAHRSGSLRSVQFVGLADRPRPLSEDEVCDAVCSGAERVAVPADAVAKTKDLIRMLPGEEANGAEGPG